MRQQILDFPQHLLKGLELAKDLHIQGEFDNVVYSAMGGSALPAEVLTNWLDLSFPFYINKGYHLPPQTNKKTLAICCSYSGNTEECISSYKEALAKDLIAVAVTSNGQLKELYEQNSTPHVLVPSGIAQRMATGYMLPVLHSILVNSDLIKSHEAEIQETAGNLKPEKWEEEGKEMAKKIKGTIPFVYSSHKLKSLSYIWKIRFNENSKVPACAHYFPELNHNELESYNKNAPRELLDLLTVIILKDPDGDPLIQKRMDLTGKILADNNVKIITVQLVGKTLLEKIFNSSLLADWATYFLSQEYGVDPLDVDAVDSFKKLMKE